MQNIIDILIIVAGLGACIGALIFSFKQVFRPRIAVKPKNYVLQLTLNQSFTFNSEHREARKHRKLLIPGHVCSMSRYEELEV